MGGDNVRSLVDPLSRAGPFKAADLLLVLGTLLDDAFAATTENWILLRGGRMVADIRSDRPSA